MTDPADHRSPAPPHAGEPRITNTPPSRPAGLLAGMRIRKKLIVLHTCFSLVLAGILALALRPAIAEVVKRAEIHEAQAILRQILTAQPAADDDGASSGMELLRGDPDRLNIDPDTASRARGQPGRPILLEAPGQPPRLIAFDPSTAEFVSATSRLEAARSAVARLYLLLTVALLCVYGLVAAALEIFVLPRQVYEPIQRLREADLAVQEGDRDRELIPESQIPADELGEIMRSRNQSITTMRRHERDLADALRELASVASDLKRKNHLIEMARQNLADADRLASLGTMSAGLSHELNTPLAVLKGLAEKLVRGRGAGLTADEAALMSRVVARLERLSDSLLDFARVRPPRTAPVELRSLVEEAWTLVRLDRDASRVEFANQLAPALVVECDGDRIVQVLVNLLRNAVDALQRGEGHIAVAAETSLRDGREWASLTITDDGPGIDPEVLKHLFEPFVSTRLDSHGTGLGLAVAEGIVREHGGVILARNRNDGAHGAVFEIMLPTHGPARGQAASAQDAADARS